MESSSASANMLMSSFNNRKAANLQEITSIFKQRAMFSHQSTTHVDQIADISIDQQEKVSSFLSTYSNDVFHSYLMTTDEFQHNDFYRILSHSMKVFTFQSGMVFKRSHYDGIYIVLSGSLIEVQDKPATPAISPQKSKLAQHFLSNGSLSNNSNQTNHSIAKHTTAAQQKKKNSKPNGLNTHRISKIIGMVVGMNRMKDPASAAAIGASSSTNNMLESTPLDDNNSFADLLNTPLLPENSSNRDKDSLVNTPSTFTQHHPNFIKRIETRGSIELKPVLPFDASNSDAIYSTPVMKPQSLAQRMSEHKFPTQFSSDQRIGKIEMEKPSLSSLLLKRQGIIINGAKENEFMQPQSTTVTRQIHPGDCIDISDSSLFGKFIYETCAARDSSSTVVCLYVSKKAIVRAVKEQIVQLRFKTRVLERVFYDVPANKIMRLAYQTYQRVLYKNQHVYRIDDTQPFDMYIIREGEVQLTLSENKQKKKQQQQQVPAQSTIAEHSRSPSKELQELCLKQLKQKQTIAPKQQFFSMKSQPNLASQHQQQSPATKPHGFNSVFCCIGAEEAFGIEEIISGANSRSTGAVVNSQYAEFFVINQETVQAFLVTEGDSVNMWYKQKRMFYDQQKELHLKLKDSKEGGDKSMGSKTKQSKRLQQKSSLSQQQLKQEHQELLQQYHSQPSDSQPHTKRIVVFNRHGSNGKVQELTLCFDALVPNTTKADQLLHEQEQTQNASIQRPTTAMARGSQTQKSVQINQQKEPHRKSVQSQYPQAQISKQYQQQQQQQQHSVQTILADATSEYMVSAPRISFISTHAKSRNSEQLPFYFAAPQSTISHLSFESSVQAAAATTVGSVEATVGQSHSIDKHHTFRETPRHMYSIESDSAIGSNTSNNNNNYISNTPRAHYPNDKVNLHEMKRVLEENRRIVKQQNIKAGFTSKSSQSSGDFRRLASAQPIFDELKQENLTHALKKITQRRGTKQHNQNERRLLATGISDEVLTTTTMTVQGDRSGSNTSRISTSRNFDKYRTLINKLHAVEQQVTNRVSMPHSSSLSTNSVPVSPRGTVVHDYINVPSNSNSTHEAQNVHMEKKRLANKRSDLYFPNRLERVNQNRFTQILHQTTSVSMTRNAEHSSSQRQALMLNLSMPKQLNERIKSAKARYNIYRNNTGCQTERITREYNMSLDV